MTDLWKHDVVILCGGQGKRLRSEIGRSQKVMAKVGKRPFLDISIKYLSRFGFTRIILCTGYQAQDVQDHYRKEKSRIKFLFSRESKPLGTGGALNHARKFVKSSSFFVLNGDSFCPVDYARFFGFHLRNKALASLAVSRVKGAKDYGTILLDQQKRIKGFREKADAAAAYVNAGVYCFDRSVFSFMPKAKKFSLETDLFPTLVNKRFYGFKINKKFFDIGTPERYKKAKKKGWRKF